MELAYRPKTGPGIGPKAKKKKLPKWLIAIIALFVIAGSAAAYYYVKLNPKNHFASSNLPVASAPANQSAVSQNDDEFNVLLLGSDERKANSSSRTDSIMLVHMNLKNHTYSVMSIPRDTRVNLPGYGETKITHASYLGGLKGGQTEAMKSTLDAVSNLTGLPINYYAETGYQGLGDMIDAVGGIDITLPFKVTLTHAWYKEDKGKVFTPGSYHLDGKMATELVHERYSLSNGDFGRQQLQEVVLLATFKKAMQPENIPHLPSLIQSTHKLLLATNMSTDDMLSLGLGLKGLNTKEIHYYQIPGHSLYAMDPVVKANLYYFVPDQAKFQTIIKEHFEN